MCAYWRNAVKARIPAGPCEVDTVRGFLIPLSAGGLEFLVVQFQCPVPVALHGPVYPLQGLVL